MDKALEMDAAKEAVLRLGLKADNTAADRAKAMGFSDDTYYHGTNKDFDSFDPTRKARVVNSHLIDESRNATYVTPNAQQASDFARSLKNNKITFDGGRVMPLKVRGKIFDYDNVDDVNKLVKELEKNKALQKSEYPLQAEDGWTLAKALEEGVRGGKWNDMEQLEVQNIIKNKGYDGYYVNEGDSFYPRPASAIYNPANIRSKFAKFNPKYAGIGAGSIMSADLLANEKHEGGLLGENVDIDNLMRENLSRILSERKLKDDIAKYGAIKPIDRNYFFGELADSMKRFTSLDRDPTGASNMFFGGGAKALDDLSYGMTPMQQMPGKIPAIPTNEAMLNLMELIGL